jgi:hypothetical protein
MARSDADRIERLKERFARPARQRPDDIDAARAALLKQSLGLRGHDIQADVWAQGSESRADALMKRYGRTIRRISE